MSKKIKVVVNVDEVKQLVSKYRGFTKKSASDLVEMGKVVADAVELGAGGLEAFCKAIKVTKRSSTIVKLKTIGEKYEILSKHIDELPCNWTTMYDIARLRLDALKESFERGVIHPLMKGKDAKELHPYENRIIRKRGKKSIQNGNKTDAFRLTVKLPANVDATTLQIIQSTMQSLEQYGVETIEGSLQIYKDQIAANDFNVEDVA